MILVGLANKTQNMSHCMKKTSICIGENKAADQLCAVTAQLISDFVFAARIVQSFFLNLKF